MFEMAIVARVALRRSSCNSDCPTGKPSCSNVRSTWSTPQRAQGPEAISGLVAGILKKVPEFRFKNLQFFRKVEVFRGRT